MDASYSSSALLVQKTDSSYSASADLKGTDSASYTTSAILLAVTQCETPNAVLLPEFIALDIHFDGTTSNVGSIALIPTLAALNIYTKSC